MSGAAARPRLARHPPALPVAPVVNPAHPLRLVVGYTVQRDPAADSGRQREAVRCANRFRHIFRIKSIS